MKKVTKAVIPAAGLGTRVLPATKAMPKGMLPIVDKPAIQYLVEEAVKSGRPAGHRTPIAPPLPGRMKPAPGGMHWTGPFWTRRPVFWHRS